MTNGFDDRDALPELIIEHDNEKYVRSVYLYRLGVASGLLENCGDKFDLGAPMSLEDMQIIEQALWGVAGELKRFELALSQKIIRAKNSALPVMDVGEALERMKENKEETDGRGQ